MKQRERSGGKVDQAEAETKAHLVFDGERFIPGTIESEIDLEHYHRYLVAVELVKDGIIADVACGAGYGSAILGKYAQQVTGIDVSDLAVASARENFGSDNVRFQVGDCTDLPFEDASLDAIVSFETLEHITAHDEFLDECKRVLKPKGLLIISTPERERYNAQLAEPNPHHVRELTEEEFSSALSARFSSVSMSSQRVLFGSLILPEGAVSQFDTLRRTNERSIVRESARARGVYLIAVCTNGPAQQFPTGSYEGGFPPNALSSLIGGIKDRDQLAHDLRGQVVDQQRRSEWAAETFKVDHARLHEALGRAVALDNQLLLERERLADSVNEIGLLQARLDLDATEISSLRLRLNLETSKVAGAETQIADARVQLQRLVDGHENERSRRATEQARVELQVRLAELQIRKERFIGLRAANAGWRRLRQNAFLAAPFDFMAFWVRTRLLKPKSALSSARDALFIRRSRLFDENFYLSRNFDVRIRGLDPVRHYLAFGWREGRDPAAGFSTRGYLRANPDVERSQANPFYHYVRFGRSENRPMASYLAVEGGASDESSSTTPYIDKPTALVQASDPYSVRPDDIVGVEAERGEKFLSRHALLSGAPDFSAAQSALVRANLSSAIVRPEDEFKPVVSIIIPVYGQLAYTLNCLHALARHASKYSFEVIVMDDRSPDDSKRWLSGIPWVRFVHQSENQGFLKTCNNAGAIAKGDYIVLLNNDTRVVDGWLDEMIGSFDQFPQAGLVGSKLFYPDGKLQEAGGIIWKDGSAWNYGRNNDPARPEYCYARRVDYVSGASIALPTDLWRQLGGFDERYAPAYCEDSDLAFRVRDVGREVWMQPLSRVIHYEGKTSGTDLTKGVKAYQVVNSQKFYDRWKDVLALHRPNAESPELERDRPLKKRVLVLDATTPTPDQDAGSVTTWMNLLILRNLGFKPHFIPNDNLLFQKTYTANLQRQGIECHYIPFDWTLEDHLQRHGASYDFVLIFRPNVATKALPLLRRYAPQAPIAFNNMDLHYLRLQRQAEVSGDVSLMPEIQKQKQLEFDVMISVDCAVVPSYEEAAILKRELPDAPVVVLPFMTDIVGTTSSFDERRDFVFIGGYNHSPNVDAVEYFVKEIWPAVRSGAPGAKFYVVGSHPPQRILDLASEDIVVTGRVDDLQPYLDRSRVCVCPVRYGAGVKGKVTTAMSHGLPVVSTTIGAEGMGVVEGRDLIVADEPADFAAATLRLYNDRELWKRISTAGLDFASEHNSMKMGARVLGEIIDTATRTHASRKPT